MLAKFKSWPPHKQRKMTVLLVTFGAVIIAMSFALSSLLSPDSSPVGRLLIAMFTLATLLFTRVLSVIVGGVEKLFGRDSR